MDADLDWCLTCEQRLHSPSTYCSLQCQMQAGPSQFAYPHPAPYTPYDDDDDDEEEIADAAPVESRWRGSDYAGIQAWAADIPRGALPDPFAAPTPAAHSTPSSSSSSFQSASFRPPPPNLLTPSRHAAPPSLSTGPPLSPPTAAPTSHALPTPCPPRRQPSSACPSAAASLGQTSRRSTIDSAPLATPRDAALPTSHPRPSLLDGMYSHVRSWVSAAPPSSSNTSHILPPTDIAAKLPPQTFLPPPLRTRPIHIRIASPPSSPGYPAPSGASWTKPHQPPALTRTTHSKPTGLDVFFRGDREHPSLRTRGRKASRAAA